MRILAFSVWAIMAVVALPDTADAQQWNGPIHRLEAPVILRLTEMPKTNFRKVSDLRISTSQQTSRVITTTSGTVETRRDKEHFIIEYIARIQEQTDGKSSNTNEFTLHILTNGLFQIESVEFSHPSIKPGRSAKLIGDLLRKQFLGARPEHFPVQPIVQNGTLGKIDLSKMSIPGWKAHATLTPIVQGTSTLGSRPVLVTRYEGPLLMESDSTVKLAWRANGSISGTSLIDRRTGFYIYSETKAEITGAYENGVPITITTSEWMTIIE